MLTANALAQFEDSIALLPFLTLFIPLIIASGGNSGSQASTLVIRAMAMDEVRLRDWWRVARREVATGLALGTVLGSIGFLRVVAFPGDTARLRAQRRAPVRRHHRRQPAGRGAVRHTGRLHAAIHPASRRAGPRQRLGAAGGHAGGRERTRDLFS
jgi:hypothetical protein